MVTSVGVEVSSAAVVPVVASLVVSLLPQAARASTRASERIKGMIFLMESSFSVLWFPWMGRSVVDGQGLALDLQDLEVHMVDPG